MPLGAYYVQAARGNHRVVLLIGFLLYSVVCFRVFRAGFNHAVVARFLVSRGGLYEQFVHTILPEFPLCKEFRIAAQQYVRTAAGHVGGNGNAAQAARLRHYFGFLGMQLGVEHLVLYAAAGKHVAQHFALFDRYGTDQYRLARRVDLYYFVHYRIELTALGAVYNVIIVYAPERLIGGDFHNVQPIYGLELRFLCLSRSGHAGKLMVHPEIILERDGGKGFILALNLNVFLGFQRLVQSVAISSAHHKAAGEFINYKHLTVLHNVVLIPREKGMRLEGLNYMVVYFGIRSVRYIVYAEEGFRLALALLGKRDRARLYVAHIVSAFLLRFAHHNVRLGKLFYVFAPHKAAYEAICLGVHIGGLFARA